jgi:hypothetical protein
MRGSFVSAHRTRAPRLTLGGCEAGADRTPALRMTRARGQRHRKQDTGAAPDAGHAAAAQVPLVGRLASPLALFYQGAGALGPRRAAVLAAAALLYTPAAPAALGAVRLWRASALLGGQLLAPWLARALPPREAAALRACAAHNA